MRIIGGIHRGRTILSPPEPPARKGRAPIDPDDEAGPSHKQKLPGAGGKLPGGATTRPITDRVKVALFDRLMSMGLTGGGRVLDVFAGTGSLGLEALSRGSEHCTFIERDKPARQLLQQNLADLNLTDQATVLGIDALSAAWTTTQQPGSIDIAFCDPPYALVQDEKSSARVVTLLAAMARLLGPNKVLVLRTPTGTPPPTAQSLGVPGLCEPDSFEYGKMTLNFYERVTE